MRLGIVANTSKVDFFNVVLKLVEKIKEIKLDFIISDTLLSFNKERIDKSSFVDNESLYNKSDIVLSIGGDGTMLNTAFDARYFSTPLLGVNFGKLGFLAEFDIHNMDRILRDIKDENYEISQRVALEGTIEGQEDKLLYAINDFVIDKGRWPKMIELTLMVDSKYVSTFSADGIIVATPTGSTGYSLSVGGPIISPQTNAFVISPISPHTLTARPLVISSTQSLKIIVNSDHKSVQVNSDGQRVDDFTTPMEICIKKSHYPVKLVHTKATDYFEILRDKLFWGVDVRKNNKKQ